MKPSRTTTTQGASWNKNWIPWFAISTASLLCYWPSFWGKFVFDDTREIVALAPFRLSGSLWDAAFVHYGLPARPVPYLTFAANQLVSREPLGFHLVNLAVHIANAILLFELIRLLLKTHATTANSETARSDRTASSIALIAALLWVVHPLNTESVTYIYQRIESLAMFFVLASIICFVWGAKSKSWFWLALSIMCSALGMASKESVCVLPLLILWVDRVFLASSWTEIIRTRGKTHAMLLATIGIVVWLIRINKGSYAEFAQHESMWKAESHSGLEHLLTQPRVLGWYLRLCFWPVGQSIQYDWGVTTSPSYWALPGLVVVAALISVAFLMFTRPRWGFLLGVPFLLLGPTSSIIPVAATAAEHRMYLPLIIPCMLIAMLIDRLTESFRSDGVNLQSANQKRLWLKGAVVLGLLVPLSIATYQRNRLYQSASDIWLDATHHAPSSFGVRKQAVSLLADEKRLDEAIAIAREFDSVDHAQSLFLMGLACSVANENERAREFLEKFVEKNPDDPEGMRLFGVSFLPDRPENAESYLRKAYELKKGDPETIKYLGFSLLGRKPKEAAEWLRKATELNPLDGDAFFLLSLALLPTNDSKGALHAVEEAIRLKPDHAEALQLRNEIRSDLRRAGQENRR